MMPKYWMAALLFLLPSCGLYNNLVDLAGEGKALIAETRERVDVVAKEADADGDGKTSGDEWLGYLLALIGVGGGGGMMVRNGKSNERKAKMEAKQEAQDERLRALEASK